MHSSNQNRGRFSGPVSQDICCICLHDFNLYVEGDLVLRRPMHLCNGIWGFQYFSWGCFFDAFPSCGLLGFPSTGRLQNTYDILSIFLLYQCMAWRVPLTSPRLARQENPKHEHWKATRHSGDLKATGSYGVTFQRGKGSGLVVHADANYAPTETRRKYVSGVAAMCGGAAIQ